METLPNEMLELIFWQLSPRDLAHCSAVCRSWYEMINQDWIWMKHCDPELEEPLRTIPSVVSPTFEIPEAETLSSPSKWKIAFLKEKHLGENWREKKILQLGEENILKFKSEKPLDVDFFTDTHIVVWYSNKIEVLDISVIAPVVVAQTVIHRNFYFINGKVGQNNLLIMEESLSIKVFKVDIANNCISLTHNLCKDILGFKNLSINANFYMYIYDGLLNIFDINMGKTLKLIPWPVKVNQNEEVSLRVLKSSPTSDFVYVSINICNGHDRRGVYNSFIYSLERFTYLPGPVMTSANFTQYVSLHDRWVVLHTPYPKSEKNGIDITVFYISQNDEVLIHDRISLSTQIRPNIDVCNGWFVFIARACNDTPSCLKAYSPSNKTLITIDENFIYKDFIIINNKFIAVFNHGLRLWKTKESYAESTWKPSSKTVEKIDLPVVRDCKINRSFTKVVKQVNRRYFSDLEIKQYGDCWYVKHLW